MKKILLIIIAGLISLSVDAQKWYVATTGDDANGDGSITYPWKTVKHAADTITDANSFAGDTIYVLAGTYTEAAITLSDSISLMGVMTASDTTIITAATGIDIITASSASGNAVDATQSISYIKFDGNLTALRAIKSNYRSSFVIHHCTFVDLLYNAIYMDGTISAWNIFPANVIPTGVKIYNCTFINNTQYTGNTGDAGHVRFMGYSGTEIYNCSFDQRDRAAGQNGDIISGYQNDGWKIHDNSFIKDDTNGTTWNFFAELLYNNGGCELYDNDFTGAACFDFSTVIPGDYGFGGKVYRNYFHCAVNPVEGYNQYPLNLEAFDYENDIYVYQNRFEKTRGAILIDNFNVSTSNIWIYYNIIEAIGNTTNHYSNGIKILTSFDGNPRPLDHLHIYNNIINAGVDSWAGIGFTVNGNVINCNIRNNIITGLFLRPIGFWLYPAATPTVNILNINKNIFFGTTSTSIYYEGGITFTNRDDTGNIVDDPLFTGTGTPPLNYKLQSGSPAKDAGISVGLTSDYGGYNVPVGPLPDIGAWEYGADEDPPNWHPTGLGWDDIYFKNNFRDTVNFTVPPTIAGAPLDLAALLPSGLTATVNDLNATQGATGNFQGQINSLNASNDAKADTSLSNLSSVAINSNLLPATSGSANLGSGAKPFGKIFGTATQISSLIVGDSTSNTIVTIDSLGYKGTEVAGYVGIDTVKFYEPVSGTIELEDVAVMHVDTVGGSSGRDLVITPTGLAAATLSATDLSVKSEIDIIHTFNAGNGLAGDTSRFDAGSIISPFFNRSADTIVVTDVISAISTGDTLSFHILYADTLNAVVPTHVSDTITMGSGGENVETKTFETDKIPPNKWVYAKVIGTTDNVNPIYFGATLSGYKIKGTYDSTLIELVYEMEVTRYLAALVTPLADSNEIKINTFVSHVKDSLSIDSLSQYFDWMQIYANQTEEAALLNLVKRDHDAAAIDAIMFTPFEGYTGATGDYLQVDYNPTADSIAFGKNDASIGVYSMTDSDSAIYEITAGVVTDFIALQASNASNNMVVRVNQTNTSTKVIPSSLGMIIACRPNQNTVSFFHNSTDLGDDVEASTAVPNAVTYVFRYSSTYSTRKLAFAFMGKNLTNEEVRKLTNCFEEYMDSNGKGVI